MEVKQYRGELKTQGEGNSLWYLDQLYDKEYWVSKNKFPKYLLEWYNLTPQEYYDIVVYDNVQPKCLCGCGLSSKFISLSKGYQDFHDKSHSASYNRDSVVEYYDSLEYKDIDSIEIKVLKYQGELIYRGDYRYIEYLDQLSEDTIYVSNKHFSNYLKNTYGISIKTYYDLVVIGNKNHKEVCPVCGEELNLVSLISGYQIFCSPSCKITSLNNKLSEERSIYFKNRIGYLNFTSKGNGEAYFYVGKVLNSNIFKFGITRLPERRFKDLNIYSGVIFKGSSYDVARIEYELKVIYNSEYLNREVFRDFYILFNKINSGVITRIDWNFND